MGGACFDVQKTLFRRHQFNMVAVAPISMKRTVSEPSVGHFLDFSMFRDFKGDATFPSGSFLECCLPKLFGSGGFWEVGGGTSSRV